MNKIAGVSLWVLCVGCLGVAVGVMVVKTGALAPPTPPAEHPAALARDTGDEASIYNNGLGENAVHEARKLWRATVGCALLSESLDEAVAPEKAARLAMELEESRKKKADAESKFEAALSDLAKADRVASVNVREFVHYLSMLNEAPSKPLSLKELCQLFNEEERIWNLTSDEILAGGFSVMTFDADGDRVQGGK